MNTIKDKISTLYNFFGNQNIFSDEIFKYEGFLDFLESALIKSTNKNKDWQNIIGPCEILNSVQKAKNDYLFKINNLGVINDLEIIGFFQTLYIEQDTLINLSLNLKIIKNKNEFGDRYSSFNEIRFLRNQTFGHPSENDGNKKKDNPISIHIYTIFDNEKHIIRVNNWKSEKEFQEFNLQEIFTTHNMYVNEILDTIIKVLNEKFIEFNSLKM